MNDHATQYASTPQLTASFRQLGEAFSTFWKDVAQQMTTENPALAQELSVLLRDGGRVRAIFDIATTSIHLQGVSPTGEALDVFFGITGEPRRDAAELH